ncbi:MAG: hypothetical protein IJS08_13740 [Victivallales bacterium]|nr:hypothetical protein [Victivallales bacterium]
MFKDWQSEMLYKYKLAKKNGDKQDAKRINKTLMDNGFYIRQTGIRQYTVEQMIRRSTK